MPAYTYKCADCSREIEVRLGVFEEYDIKCSECSGEMKKVILPVFVVSKVKKDKKVGILTNKLIEKSREELKMDKKMASNKDFE